MRTNEAFIIATSIAALIHSTWSIGTLMSGGQPTASISVEFLGWIIPALLMAFALDVGQVSTSRAIRVHGLTPARGVTFAIFCIATYYLQFLYVIHHTPSVDLSAGIRAEWQPLVALIRDAAVWIIPAFLPLSTLLYTVSSDSDTPKRKVEPVAIAVTTPAQISPENQAVLDSLEAEYIANEAKRLGVSPNMIATKIPKTKGRAPVEGEFTQTTPRAKRRIAPGNIE